MTIENYHRIGSLLPLEGGMPKFAQLYVYDTRNEIENRASFISSTGNKLNVDLGLVKDLVEMIDEHNVLAKSFRRVHDVYTHGQQLSVSLRLFRSRKSDPRTYNLPSVDEVAGLIVGDYDSVDCGRDIVVQSQNGQLQRIHETHTSFIPLQYPLLFPFGEDGYQENISFRASGGVSTIGCRKRVSLREFISFRLHERPTEESVILMSRRLFQQFVVDCYSMIEAQRLSFNRNNQVSIRKDFLCGLQEAVNRGDVDPSSIGSRIVLPSSFTGGQRYMFNNCQDAKAICRHFGYPDLFLTVTCNPKWPKIERHVIARGLSAYDRPDIACRVFRVKLDQLMCDFKKGEFFGKVNARMYTIEFQKHGLPHAHILLWLDSADKLDIVEVIDSVICAEFPDPGRYPKLFDVVSTFMVHGPCGHARKGSPCMREGKCSKYFPKKFVDKTLFDYDGYPIYMRRNSGISIVRKGIDLDNRFIVPYNPKMLMKYQAHINIEYCNKSNSIKYLFKYVNKGVDRVTVSMSVGDGGNAESEVVDEIQQCYDCRYLSPCESVWRIFKFDIHHRWPPVQRLNFHLPQQQLVVFKDWDMIDNVVERSRDKKTPFLAWMEANSKFDAGKNLTYGEFPSKFIYDAGLQVWRPRRKGFSIRRVNFAPPGSGEVYYLCLLLNVQKGSTSFESIRTVDGILHPTFRDACNALGLLTDDKEFVDGIVETSFLASGMYLRYGTLDVDCDDDVKSFANWILNLGDGNLGEYNDGEAEVQIPEDLLLSSTTNPLADIVSFTYPDILVNCTSPGFFQDRAILAPTLEIVDEVNQYMMSLFPGEMKVYLSSDTLWKVDDEVGVQSDWLTTEFLNDIKFSGLPDHKLVLKIGIPVMLMRNLDISAGLCNGTRLIVKDLGVNVIGARVVTGSHVGTKVYIARMNLIPSDGMNPLRFQRRQFPLCVSFAMTINKSQGQSLSHVDVFLQRSVFTHGQLYVAVSRVKNKKRAKDLNL